MTPRMLPRRISLVLALIALLTSTILTGACAKAPPTLSPAGVRAFNTARVVKALDVLRDTAISANAQVPPLVSTDTTRKVVLYHQATLKTIQALETGWQAAVRAGLDSVVQTLPPNEQAILGPYAVLISAILAEVP